MNNDKKIIIFLVIRNEGEYLNEWLQYHIGLGVDKFIILDDQSSDNTKETLIPYIKLGIVHYFIDVAERKCKVHREKYYNMFKEQYHGSLMIYIDIDEFLYLNNININELHNLKKNVYFMTCRELVRKTKETSIHLFNKNIFSRLRPKYIDYIQTIGNFNKPIIRINKNKIPNFITSHNLTIYGEEHEVFYLDSCITYFHIKFTSIQEELLKVTKYCKTKVNNYYYNEESIRNKLKRMYVVCNCEFKLINSYSKKLFKQFFNDNGYIIINNFFEREIINNVYNNARMVYINQMKQLKIINDEDISNNEFEEGMKTLFTNNFDVFLNCGKQCQHLISLWEISLNKRLLEYLEIFGLKTPIISTRPVLFSNSKHIARNSINHTVPPHQDWASMQGSINSMVVWIPLIDINQELGSIALVPKSHKNGLLSKEKVESFGIVNKYKKEDFISFDVKQGDIIIFNSFLVHKSGNNITDNIRWSCHLRYNDLNDKSFIKRNYPHAYIYKPIEEYLTPELNTKEEINNYLINQ